MQALDVLSTNSTIKNMMGYTDSMLSEDAVAVKNLQSELSFAIQSGSVSDIYVYFYDSHSIVGARSRRYNNAMLGLFCDLYEITEQDFNNIINYKGNFGSHIFNDGRFWMMQSVHDKYYDKKAVLIVESQIENSINYMDEVYRNNILVLTADDTKLFGSVELEADIFNQLLAAPKEPFRVEIKKEGYYVVSEDIPSMGWRCFIGIPETKLDEGLKLFWGLLIAEFTGAIILMFLLSWKFARKTYRPVEQLMNTLNNGRDERFKETYDSLNDKLKLLLDENRKMKKKARQSQIYWDTKKVSEILDGKITDLDITMQILDDFAGLKKSACWMLALIYIPKDIDRLLKYDEYYIMEEKDIDLKFFILKNVMSELLFSKYPGNLFWKDDYYVLCAGLEDEASKADILNQLQDMIDFYKSAFNAEICIMAGRCEKGFERVSEIYTELLEEMKYNTFWINDDLRGKVWILSDMSDEQPSVSFNAYLDSSRRLLNCLDAGDYKEAYKVLDYIFQKTFPKNKKFLKYNIYRMYGLISTLTMTLSVSTNSEDRDFFEKLHYEERLFNVKNVQQLMNISKELFEAIIKYNSNKSKEGMPTWLAGVLKYIQDNFTDMNISVAEIAERFQISVPHLSRTFKGCMGNGVLEYIHKLRVEKAKEFMAKGKNVRETAESVGYLDAKALTRAFKRYEGITPGQYKEVVGMQAGKSPKSKPPEDIV